MGPLRSEQKVGHVLLLDTKVDRTVVSTATSVLPEITRGPGRTETRDGSNTLPAVPVAGSKGWLPSMVDVGRKEVRMCCGTAVYLVYERRIPANM